MSLDEIWKALDNGKIVCWIHSGYTIKPVKSNNTKYSDMTERNGLALECRHDNGFGGLLHTGEFEQCFIKG